MGRPPRVTQPGLAYHVLNRRVMRLPLFQKDDDYLAFERVLAEAHLRRPMRILAYCLIPNYWHLVAEAAQRTKGRARIIPTPSLAIAARLLPGSIPSRARACRTLGHFE